MDKTNTEKRRTRPDCLNGYGDGPTHCTLEVGHRGPCNHMDFHAEQASVWGGGDDAWAQAIAHIQRVDEAVIAKVTDAVGKGATAEQIFTMCVDGYMQPSNPRRKQALERLETLKPRVLEELAGALGFGTPPHLLPHIVINPLLRGGSAI